MDSTPQNGGQRPLLSKSDRLGPCSFGKNGNRFCNDPTHPNYAISVIWRLRFIAPENQHDGVPARVLQPSFRAVRTLAAARARRLHLLV